MKNKSERTYRRDLNNHPSQLEHILLFAHDMDGKGWYRNLRSIYFLYLTNFGNQLKGLILFNSLLSIPLNNLSFAYCSLDFISGYFSILYLKKASQVMERNHGILDDISMPCGVVWDWRKSSCPWRSQWKQEWAFTLTWSKYYKIPGC